MGILGSVLIDNKRNSAIEFCKKNNFDTNVDEFSNDEVEEFYRDLDYYLDESD